MQLQRNGAIERLKRRWRIEEWPPADRRLVFGSRRGGVGPLPRSTCIFLNRFVVRASRHASFRHPGVRVVEHGVARTHDAQVLGLECREFLLEGRKRELQVDEIVGERREFRALQFEFTFVRDRTPCRGS